MLGIIGAMEEETEQFYEMMSDVTVTIAAGMKFRQGKMNGKDVVIVRSGIGKVNAAVCSQILVDRYHVDAIINTGIAGSLKNEINIGDIVLSTDALQHDVDAAAFGYEPGHIPQMGKKEFKADDRLIEIGLACCRKVNPDIQTFTGRIVTGDQFIGDDDKKKWLRETFEGSCTEMEGAAIAQVAYLNQIPFLIVRAISDKADGSVVMDYNTFEAAAIRHSVRLVSAMVEMI